jgi:hypothetical protein
MGNQAPAGAVPVTSGDEPSPRTPPKARMLQRALNVLGPVNLACTAGVIGVTAMLAMKSGKSTKWSLLARLLP